MDVFEGIVISVLSGIILGLFWGTKKFVKKRIERGNQISYLASLIVEFRNLIYKAKTIDVTAIGRTLQRDAIRKAYYDDMRKQVESVLERRSSCLSCDEIQQIRNVFFTDMYPAVALNDEGYDRIFRELESINWLNLPSRNT